MYAEEYADGITRVLFHCSKLATWCFKLRETFPKGYVTQKTNKEERPAEQSDKAESFWESYGTKFC